MKQPKWSNPKGMHKSKYKSFKNPQYEIYTLEGDKYITSYSNLKSAKKYCKSNYPVRYLIKKNIGTVK